MAMSSLQPRQGYAKSRGMPTRSAADPRLPIAAETTREPPPNRRRLPDAAVRALGEAAARRREGARATGERDESQAMKEVGGRAGLDPTRYGDWEVNGLASDF
jgi:hypothetical protein